MPNRSVLWVNTGTSNHQVINCFFDSGRYLFDVIGRKIEWLLGWYLFENFKFGHCFFLNYTSMFEYFVTKET